MGDMSDVVDGADVRLRELDSGFVAIATLNAVEARRYELLVTGRGRGDVQGVLRGIMLGRGVQSRQINGGEVRLTVVAVPVDPWCVRQWVIWVEVTRRSTPPMAKWSFELRRSTLRAHLRGLNGPKILQHRSIFMSA